MQGSFRCSFFIFSAFLAIVFGDPNLAAAATQTTKPIVATTTLSGDLNGDNKIDKTDYAILKSKMGLRGAKAGNADLNRDGVVDLKDFAIFRRKFEQASKPLNVVVQSPVPSSAPAGASSSAPSPNTAPVSSITMRFDQKITGFDVRDVRLTRDGVNILTGQESLTSADGKTWIFSGIAGVTSQDGKYEFRIVSANSNIAGETLSNLPADTLTSWTVYNPPASVSINNVPVNPVASGPNSVQFVFDKAVRGLTLSNISMNWEGGDNVLTTSQTISSTDGKVWTLGNLAALARKAGVYNISINTQDVKDSIGNPVNLSAQTKFAVLADIKPSDKFLRMIVNSGHQFMQPDRFRNMTHASGESLLTIGTRMNYVNDPGVFGSLLGGSSSGGAVTNDLSRQAYQLLYSQYDSAHTEAVTGSYIGFGSLKGAVKTAALGYFPVDAQSIDLFQGLNLLDPVSTSANNDAFVNVNDPASFERLYESHYKEAIGLGVRGKQEIIHFDEVGYVYGIWQKNVELLSRLKTALNKEGVLVSFNLGGWSWTRPSQLTGPNVIQDVIKMTNSVMVESLWNHEPKATGGTFRTVESTRMIVDNLRAVMNAGVAVELIATQHLANQNIIDIKDGKVVTHNGEKKLLVTLARDHHIFPSSGRVGDQIYLSDLDGYISFLAVRWTPEEVPGRPDQVYLKPSLPLDQLVAASGVVGAVKLSKGKLHDLQANVRITAAMAMLARNPGNRIMLHYTPGAALPGNGVPNSPDNWFYWPAQLGNPTADYVVDSADPQGRILTLHRDFANGKLIVHPMEGWVEIKLNSTPNITPIS